MPATGTAGSTRGDRKPPGEPNGEAPYQACPASKRSVPPSGRRRRPDIVHTSVYLPKAVYQALREIAFKEDRKIHGHLEK
jgi:hypothetical protein